MKISSKLNREANGKTVVIFSSERFYVTSEENKNNLENCIDHLNQLGVPFRIGQGCYKGDCEPCFVCTPENESQLESIKYLAKELYNQESVLIRSEHNVSLWFCQDNTIQEIGKKLIAVSTVEAMTQDSYTQLGPYYYIVN
jgi:hypothetical protein